eukprot:3934326-Rhodomonas_salina.1
MEGKFNITPQEFPTTKNSELEAEYRKLFGSTLFVSCWSKPNVSFAINHLARFATCPTNKVWKVLKRVLRYLVTTKDQGISWTRSPTSLGKTGHRRGELYAYVDTAYADCSITRKSTMGYVLMLNAGAISWRSKHEPIVALSTAEVEYVAACYAAQEVVS